MACGSVKETAAVNRGPSSCDNNSTCPKEDLHQLMLLRNWLINQTLLHQHLQRRRRLRRHAAEQSDPCESFSLSRLCHHLQTTKTSRAVGWPTGHSDKNLVASEPANVPTGQHDSLSGRDVGGTLLDQRITPLLLEVEARTSHPRAKTDITSIPRKVLK